MATESLRTLSRASTLATGQIALMAYRGRKEADQTKGNKVPWPSRHAWWIAKRSVSFPELIESILCGGILCRVWI